MPEDNMDDFFNQALAESGIKVGSQEKSESAEKQEPQTPIVDPSIKDDSFVEIEKPSSEMQDAVKTGDDTENGKGPNGESSLDSKREASDNSSDIIDLNVGDDNASANDNSNAGNTFNVSEMFGSDFKTIDEVIEQLNYAHELQAKLTELENKKPSYANEFVEKLDEYVRNGGDPAYFAKVQSVNIDSLSPMDALKLDLQWQHGLTDEEAQSLIDSKYDLSEYEEDGGFNPKSVQLKIDSNEAKKNLKARQADNTLIEPKAQGLSEEQWLAKQKEAATEAENNDKIRMWDEQKGWAPEVDKAISGLKEKGVVLEIGNGKGFRFAYEKDEKYTEELIGKVDQALYDSGLSRTDNPKLAKDITENLFFLENRAEIMNAFANKVRSMKDEEYFRMSNNPSALKRGDAPATSADKPVSAEDQMSSIWEKG